jgi:hypothetical protein
MSLIKLSLIIGACLIILGALFKISHWPGGNILTILGFLTLTIYEVMRIKKTK